MPKHKKNITWKKYEFLYHPYDGSLRMKDKSTNSVLAIIPKNDVHQLFKFLSFINKGIKL